MRDKDLQIDTCCLNTKGMCHLERITYTGPQSNILYCISCSCLF